ncbi:hypothetical protein GWI72_10010 [Microvirga tunisiensis]|uniref:Uncharacterized protein n=2 Tax=Pannonibacter tanglangensis TaxID=2750084 RepID=A0ABW9ZG50_9HYPH|nr:MULTISPECIES: hypothetical protein [unclassified Pannonibacter]NBN63028.1 hypothetical protein [Pannonibacter sp. XCT-34]NBN78600.1 hypothetical protein [Pannonibacter sp. XCT-53]
MLKAGLIALGLLLPVPALAADATTPVREVMSVTEANWREGASEFQDVFADDRLGRLFSKDFAERYRKAAASEYAKEAGTPFSYDVIVNAQDGCALRNISITSGPARDGASEVKARFQGLTCFGSDQEYQAFTETRFRVISEGGKPVIDDIILTMDGSAFSIKSELDAIAAQ